MTAVEVLEQHGYTLTSNARNSERYDTLPVSSIVRFTKFRGEWRAKVETVGANACLMRPWMVKAIDMRLDELNSGDVE